MSAVKSKNISEARIKEFYKKYKWNIDSKSWQGQRNNPVPESKVVSAIKDFYPDINLTEDLGLFLGELKKISQEEYNRLKTEKNKRRLNEDENIILAFPDIKKVENSKGEIVKEIVLPTTANCQFLMKAMQLKIETDDYKNEMHYNYKSIARKTFYQDKRSHKKKSTDYTSLVNTVSDELIRHSVADARKLAKETIIEVAQANIRNPVREWLNELPEDSSSKYLEEFIADVFRFHDDCSDDEIKFKTKLIVKWFIQAVAAGLEESGTNPYPLVLTLTGGQNIGKSTIVRKLLPPELEDYIGSEKTLNTSDKDSRIELLRYFIVELGEVATSFRRSDRDSLKSFLTSPYDEFRRPYAPAPENIKRKTVFVSTNNNPKFLVDETGSRRFLSIKLSDSRSESWWTKWDINKVWTQAKYLYKKGESFSLSTEEVKELNIYNEEQRVSSVFDFMIGKYINLELTIKTAGRTPEIPRRDIQSVHKTGFYDTMELYKEIMLKSYDEAYKGFVETDIPKFIFKVPNKKEFNEFESSLLMTIKKKTPKKVESTKQAQLWFIVWQDENQEENFSQVPF